MRVQEQFPPFLTRKEAARLLGLRPKTLANWASSGMGPPFLRLGRRVLYRSQDLLEWLKAHAVEVKTTRGR